MKRAEDGLPIVGFNSKELGVRVPPNTSSDVDLDADQHVQINGRGMSVASTWRILPGHLIPKRLKRQFPGATGSNAIACFKMGNGPFAPEEINDALRLQLKPSNQRSGNVTPRRSMHIDEFQGELARTREHWVVDEDET